MKLKRSQSICRIVTKNNHRRSVEPKEPSPSPEPEPVLTQPQPKTGAIRKRDRYTFPRNRLLAARIILLHSKPSSSLSRRRRAQGLKHMEAIHDRIDDDCNILKRLNVPHAEESREVMASEDVKRVRRLRKVLVPGEQREQLVYCHAIEPERVACNARKLVLSGPVVGGEDPWKFVLQGRARPTSKLSQCENVSAF